MPSWSFGPRSARIGFQEPLGRSAWDRLNQLRVGFKHKGNLPNPSVVADLMPGAKAFFAETTRLFLDLDYETVSLADLIPNAEARKCVKDAEQCFADSDIPSALLSLGIAFDLLYSNAYQRSYGVLVERSNWRLSTGDRDVRELARLLKIERVANHLDAVTDTLNMVLLGIDLRDFGAFLLSLPYDNALRLGHWIIVGSVTRRISNLKTITSVWSL